MLHKMNFAKELEYVGNLNQLFNVKQYSFTDGKGKGVRAVDVDNGGGLFFTVVPDKCMDIYQIRYRGTNINFLTPAGMVSPEYRNPDNFLSCFFGGFLTTCGLSNIGVPCEDNGISLPEHGTINNTPSENFCVSVCENEEGPAVTLRGSMNESRLFGGNLRLTRQFVCRYGSSEIEMTDTLENRGFYEMPFMLLYHINFGYPLLDENASYMIPSRKVTARNRHAFDGISRWNVIEKPQDAFEEMCYYHDVQADENNRAVIGISNKDRNVKAEVQYDKSVLDHLVQWKMFGKGEYVTGIEPCNATIDGRADARANGSLKFIKPHEKIEYRFRFRFGPAA